MVSPEFAVKASRRSRNYGNAKRKETREVRQFAEPEATPVQAKLLERYWLCVVGCDVAGGGGVGEALSVRININPASKTKTIVKPSGTKKVVPRRSTLGMLSLSAIDTSKPSLIA
jgi:hypothetical protein